MQDFFTLLLTMKSPKNFEKGTSIKNVRLLGRQVSQAKLDKEGWYIFEKQTSDFPKTKRKTKRKTKLFQSESMKNADVS